MAKKVRKWSQNKKFSTVEKRIHNLKRTTHGQLYPHLIAKYDTAALTAEELKQIGEDK